MKKKFKSTNATNLDFIVVVNYITHSYCRWYGRPNTPRENMYRQNNKRFDEGARCRGYVRALLRLQSLYVL